MIDLIVSDMDGTLLNGNMRIPKENRDAIMHTYQMGIPFIVCTGRNFGEAKPVLDEAGIRCPIIGLNGAVHFDRNGTINWATGISDADALGVFKVGEELGIYTEAMTIDHVYSSSKKNRILGLTELIYRMNPHMSKKEAEDRATQSNEVKNIIYRNDLKTLITEDNQEILKITFTDHKGPEGLAPLRAAIEEQFPDLVVTSSFKYNIEVTHKLATKGLALKKYCDLHGYQIENVLALGDNFNDVSMLQIAGYSFAMKNAEEGVKKEAKYETGTNNEAGVAHAIAKAIELAGYEEGDYIHFA